MMHKVDQRLWAPVDAVKFFLWWELRTEAVWRTHPCGRPAEDWWGTVWGPASAATQQSLVTTEGSHTLHYSNCTAAKEASCRGSDDAYFSEQAPFIQVHVFRAARHESTLVSGRGPNCVVSLQRKIFTLWDANVYFLEECKKHLSPTLQINF